MHYFLNMTLPKVSNSLTILHMLTVIAMVSLALSEAINYENSTKQKRQLFREQLLPHKGGKIPDSAFHPERLALNRLNQQGISVPDGTILDQRPVERHPYVKIRMPETIKVTLMEDGRYVAPPGRYHYDKPPSVDTTYVIRTPHKMFPKGFFENTNSKQINSLWMGVASGIISKYYKQNEIVNWKPPKWYNKVSNTTPKNHVANDDVTDPSQFLSEYSSFLEKLHNEYDK